MKTNNQHSVISNSANERSSSKN